MTAPTIFLIGIAATCMILIFAIGVYSDGIKGGLFALAGWIIIIGATNGISVFLYWISIRLATK